MNIHISWSVILFALGLSAADFASADIFAFSEEDGSISLSNQPTDSRYTRIVQAAEGEHHPDGNHHLPSEASAPNETTINKTAIAALPTKKAMTFGSLINEAARIHDMEAALLHAVIAVESNYNTRAVSTAGAVGLMQLMPATAKRFGVKNIYDATQNVHGGTRYLKYLLHRFDNDPRLTLAAYNAGEGAVIRYGNKIPPYRETRAYVNKVMELYNQYRAYASGLSL